MIAQLTGPYTHDVNMSSGLKECRLVSTFLLVKTFFPTYTQLDDIAHHTRKRSSIVLALQLVNESYLFTVRPSVTHFSVNTIKT